MREDGKRTKQLFAAAFVVWGVAVLGVGAYVFGPHGVAYTSGTKAGDAEPNVQTQAWRAVHVVSEGCGCSMRVIRKLAERKARKDVSETVVLVGKLPDEELRAGGFVVEHVSANEVEQRYGVKGGPWLKVWTPGGELKYSGGYSGRQIASVGDVGDDEILSSVVRGESVSARPAFGCAISSEMKRAVDPLGLLSR